MPEKQTTVRCGYKALPIAALCVACLFWVASEGVLVDSVAEAAPAPSCPGGGFCSKKTGNNGGCTPRACCEKDEVACYVTRVAKKYPKLKAEKIGYCWQSSPDGKKQPWCETTECGDTLCGEGCSTDGQTSWPTDKYIPMRGQPCPGDPAM